MHFLPKPYAKEVLPQLRKKCEGTAPPEALKAINKCIADIEVSNDAPTLVDLKDFIAHASANADTSNKLKKGKP